MSIPIILILFITGCLVGFLAGFFGVGGGVILVPVLIFFFELQNFHHDVITPMAMGTSLMIVVFASISSAIKHNKNRNVSKEGFIYIGIPSVVLAILGSFLASSLPGDILRKVFAIAVLSVAIRLSFEKTTSNENKTFSISKLKLTTIGSIVGFLSSLTGIGGGVFSIPLMYYFAKFPIKLAIGTSSATVIITASAAVTGYIFNGINNNLLPSYTLGYVDYLHAIPLIIGTVALARFGASVAYKTSAAWLRKFFSLFLFFNSIYMFFK